MNTYLVTASTTDRREFTYRVEHETEREAVMLAYATHGAAIRAGEEHSPLTPWHSVERVS